MAVVKAPGPARSGMARGITDISSVSEVSCSSYLDDCVIVLCPSSISTDMIISRMPPAIVKANILMPKMWKMVVPVIVTMRTVTAAIMDRFFHYDRFLGIIEPFKNGDKKRNISQRIYDDEQ